MVRIVTSTTLCLAREAMFKWKSEKSLTKGLEVNIITIYDWRVFFNTVIVGHIVYPSKNDFRLADE